MKRRMWICVIAVLTLAIALPACAEAKLTDQADLRASIADCAQFGQYDALAEALLCAASIPYGAGLEDCVAELQGKGFDFEYEIYAALPNDVREQIGSWIDGDAGQIPVMREAALVFSPTVALYLRTESSMVDLIPADGDFADAGVNVTEDMALWKPDGEPTEGSVIAAHLQCFDEASQTWITWTFAPSDVYRAE